MFYRLSKIAAHVGVVFAIWMVAIIADKQFDFTKYAIWKTEGQLDFTESFGLGMLISIANMIPLYLCFKLDKQLTQIEDSGFNLISTVNIQIYKLLIRKRQKIKVDKEK